MQTFSIAPAASKAVWFLPVVLLPVLLITVGLIAVSMRGSRNTTFTLTQAGLAIRGDLYGRTIPSDQLRADAARRVDFAASPDLTPSWRTMGTGLPGYQAGWFRLRSGERALVYLTDRSRAVYIPTTDGYSVLISPSDPDAFLSALKTLER